MSEQNLWLKENRKTLKVMISNKAVLDLFYSKVALNINKHEEQ